MMKLSYFALKFQCLCSCLCYKLSCFLRPFGYSLLRLYRFILRRFADSFVLELLYFIFLSVFGFVGLKALKPRTNIEPRDLDLFFTSLSAVTVSSMSTLETEVFSSPQLVVITVLMFAGGEVFTSMLGLFLKIQDLEFQDMEAKVVSAGNSSLRDLDYTYSGGLEAGVVEKTPENDTENPESAKNLSDVQCHDYSPSHGSLMLNSMKLLALIVLVYLITVHLLGVTLVSLYLAVSSSASNVLRTKKLNPFTFSVFTVVSTFANCGFLPTNENMVVFRQNSGLLLILIPQVLLGNTLYPPFLRVSIVAISKILRKQRERFEFILKSSGEIKYLHLFSGLRCSLIAMTALGFVLIQLVMFCVMEWNSDTLKGLNSYEKFVGSLFLTVNSRHTGESTVDISVVSPAVLVLFVVMMYLPPYTSFFPVNYKDEKEERKKKGFVENMILSQLSYLSILLLLICITERDNIREDPLNFSLFNILVEVVSAYGNVGFTTGYSCGRTVKRDGVCEDKWFGLVGRWSDEGKALLIIVMLLGRLKKFNMRGGKSWKLL